jgi:hypothetical protein
MFRSGLRLLQTSGFVKLKINNGSDNQESYLGDVVVHLTSTNYICEICEIGDEKI